jgi:hypothetical protein
MRWKKTRVGVEKRYSISERRAADPKRRLGNGSGILTTQCNSKQPEPLQLHAGPTHDGCVGISNKSGDTDRIASPSHRHLSLQLPELFLFIFFLGMCLSFD